MADGDGSGQRRAPTTPLLLGASGLLPFVGLALLLLTGWHDALGLSASGIRSALAAYGAVVASFLGGIRWGLALGERGSGGARDFVLSIAPALVAWACLALPRPWDMAALGALILLWGVVDQDLIRRGLAPSWFGWLRATLSGGAGLSLLAASLA